MAFNLPPDDIFVEAPGRSSLVWPHAVDVVRRLAGEVVHEGAHGDLELRAGGGWSASGGATRVA